MARDTEESTETPAQRVDALGDDQVREVLLKLVASVVANKSTRHVPDLLHDYCLLAKFEVYDADHAWTLIEDRARDEARAEID